MTFHSIFISCSCLSNTVAIINCKIFKFGIFCNVAFSYTQCLGDKTNCSALVGCIDIGVGMFGEKLRRERRENKKKKKLPNCGLPKFAMLVASTLLGPRVFLFISFYSFFYDASLMFFNWEIKSAYLDLNNIK